MKVQSLTVENRGDQGRAKLSAGGDTAGTVQGSVSLTYAVSASTCCPTGDFKDWLGGILSTMYFLSICSTPGKLTSLLHIRLAHHR